MNKEDDCGCQGCFDALKGGFQDLNKIAEIGLTPNTHNALEGKE